MESVCAALEQFDPEVAYNFAWISPCTLLRPVLLDGCFRPSITPKESIRSHFSRWNRSSGTCASFRFRLLECHRLYTASFTTPPFFVRQPSFAWLARVVFVWNPWHAVFGHPPSPLLLLLSISLPSSPSPRFHLFTSPGPRRLQPLAVPPEATTDAPHFETRPRLADSPLHPQHERTAPKEYASIHSPVYHRFLEMCALYLSGTRAPRSQGMLLVSAASASFRSYTVAASGAGCSVYGPGLIFLTGRYPFRRCG